MSSPPVDNEQTEAPPNESLNSANQPQMAPPLMVRGARERRSLVCSVMRAVKGIVSVSSSPGK